MSSLNGSEKLQVEVEGESTRESALPTSIHLMRPIGKFRGRSTHGEPSTCLGDYSLALVRLQVQFSLFQNLPLDLAQERCSLELGITSRGGQGRGQSRVAERDHRLEGGLTLGRRRIGVGEERGHAVTDRIRLESRAGQ